MYDDYIMSTRSQPTKAWLIVFADLISLLLAFFVMLFAMSNVERPKWQALVDALSPTETAKIQTDLPRTASKLRVAGLTETNAMNLDYLSAVLRAQMAEEAVFHGSLIQRLDDRLIISIPGDLMFKAGSSKPTKDARSLLAIISSVLGHSANRIDIYGHSDPTPIKTDDFPSNWELSIDRAASVAAEVNKSGYKRQVGIFGYADTRFEDISYTLAANKRMEMARRVDVVIRHHTAQGVQR